MLNIHPNLYSMSQINLMEHMKHSTSRDFRIDAASLLSALQEQASSEDEDENDTVADKRDSLTDSNRVRILYFTY